MKDNIIIISSHKCATTSTFNFIHGLGYKKFYEKNWHNDNVFKNEIYQGNIDYFKEIFKEYNEGYVFNDSPFNFHDYYKYFNENFSNVKFILVKREEEEWFNSFLKWQNNKRVINFRKKYGFTDQLFNYKKLVNIENKDFIIKNYKERINDIEKYFKDKKNFISLDLYDKEKSQKICKFLNIDYENQNFNYNNKNNE